MRVVGAGANGRRQPRFTEGIASGRICAGDPNLPRLPADRLQAGM